MKRSLKNEINIGDDIWYYNESLAPIEAVVTDILRYEIKFKVLNQNQERSVINSYVYKRPEELDILIDQIYSDIRYLRIAIKDLKIEYA